MKKLLLHSLGILSAALLTGGLRAEAASPPRNGWYEENGAKYWYENGVRQGTTGRGKEIYDPASNAWYWLDAEQNGRMACSKDVYMENGDKWVRYDADGHMVKGENYYNGAWYRFDEITGAMIKGLHYENAPGGSTKVYYYDSGSGRMVKGETVIDGVNWHFDETTGVGLHQRWAEVDGGKYWYEDGKRQGLEGRGKEIYDAASDAWYWLDADAQGRMAAGKDVYQESNGGKWVRYDNNGHMVKGENYYNGAWYRFDEITGAMIKGFYYKDTSDNSTDTYYYDLDSGRMVKGETVMDGAIWHFDETTGTALHQRWAEIDGGKYWYEGGKRQGLEGRGKEIYDAASNAWYWLDADAQGRMAAGKDVYQESNGGKWVRYDNDGHMVKGHNYYENNWYYFDPVTGAMAKGWLHETLNNGVVNTYYYDTDTGRRIKGLAEIDGVPCAFDDHTGLALNRQWRTIDGANYWYEGGKRQGLEGRGKEIYDAASNAWYWLDGTEGGRMAVNKDIYQEADGGKWVRYDQYGHMVKGWNEKAGKHYYFDLATGAMYKGTHIINDVEYYFNKDTGVLEGSQGDIPFNYVWDPVKYTYRKADGTVDHYVEKTYDDKGRVIIEQTFAANQRTTERMSYAYDNNDNIIRETKREYSGSSYRQTEYIYTFDANGRKVKVEYTDSKDSSKSYYQTLQYDGEGNVIEMITYNTRSVKTGCERNFYSKNQMIQKTVYTYKDGREIPTFFYTYKYDGSNRMTEEAYYKYDEKDFGKHTLVYRDTFSYDRDGNCLRHEEYNKDDVREKYTEYAYHTYMGHAYESMAMTYKSDGILISGYISYWDRGRMISSTKYKEYRTEESHTIYDGSAFPTDGSIKTYTTKDYTYYPNNTMKEIVETEWRLNSYE